MKIREPSRLNLMQKQGLRKVGKSNTALDSYFTTGGGKERSAGVYAEQRTSREALIEEQGLLGRTRTPRAHFISYPIFYHITFPSPSHYTRYPDDALSPTHGPKSAGVPTPCEEISHVANLG